MGARPIFVPAGELVAGGVADRVVASRRVDRPRGPHLRRAARDRAALPVPRARAEAPPVAVGAVAGPALRARLARGEDASTLGALVSAQLRDAGLLGPEGAALPSLLALYARDADAIAARAAAMVAELGPDAGGFVATDPDGRFQGIERVDVPEAARASTLARLLAGYLAEARVRSAADGPRPRPPRRRRPRRDRAPRAAPRRRRGLRARRRGPRVRRRATAARGPRAPSRSRACSRRASSPTRASRPGCRCSSPTTSAAGDPAGAYGMCCATSRPSTNTCTCAGIPCVARSIRSDARFAIAFATVCVVPSFICRSTR